MKKITLSLLALVCAITCAFGLAACGGGNDTVAVESVTLNKTTLTLEIGGTETLTATVTPNNATDKAVTWSSSAPSIASIDNAGKVTAKSEGTATITAKTANDKSATCTVTVKEAIDYTVRQTQWEQIISDLTNPLPFKEQNFTARGTIRGVNWDEENKTWLTNEWEEIHEFYVCSDKYRWRLYIDSEDENSIYEQWTEKDGNYSQTRYDYWNNAWHKDESVSDVPCEEDELFLDGTPHFNLLDFEWDNFQYDETEHCYKNKSPIESQFGVGEGEDGAIYNMLSNVKVYFENGKLVKFTMDGEQATIQKLSVACTFVYSETNITLPQVD